MIAWICARHLLPLEILELIWRQHGSQVIIVQPASQLAFYLSESGIWPIYRQIIVIAVELITVRLNIFLYYKELHYLQIESYCYA